MPWLQQLLRRVKWTTLRSIGNSPTVRLTIVIPLVGYMIIFNDTVVQYLQLTPELFGEEQRAQIEERVRSVRVSARLLLIYFGLCLIALASTVYAFLCPQEIKRYAMATDYVAGSVEHMSDSVIANLPVRMPSNLSKLSPGGRTFAHDPFLTTAR